MKINFKFLIFHLGRISLIGRIGLISLISILIFNFLPIGANAAVIKKPPADLGLVGYWSLNEGQGGLATDSSGNGNTGALTNGPVWANGKLGKALSFDGSDDVVKTNSDSLGIS